MDSDAPPASPSPEGALRAPPYRRSATPAPPRSPPECDPVLLQDGFVVLAILASIAVALHTSSILDAVTTVLTGFQPVR